MSVEIWGILIYVVLQLVVASLLLRGISSEKDYFLAGRSLGPLLATFSTFATWFGAETCMGSAGLVFRDGLSGGKSDPLGYASCLLIFGLLFAARLWKRNLTTLGDLFRERYSKGVELFAVFLMIPTSVMWAAAQIRAFGQILAASSGMEVMVAITVATAIVIVYTAVGGLMADCVNDLVHGLCLIVGMFALVVVVVMQFGSLEGVSAAIGAERLSLFPATGDGLWHRLDKLAVPIFGSLVCQELVSRSLASRSAQIARNATLWAAGIYFVIGLMPVFLGLIGPAVVPNLDDPEQLLPRLAHLYLPTFLYIIFAGALVSAILSTVDSALLAVSALFSHNVIFPLRPGLKEKQKVLIARFVVLTCGIIAYCLAVFGDGIYALVQMASSWGSSGLVVITCFALFGGRFGSAPAAIAALAFGLFSLPIAENILELDAPYLFSLAMATGSYVVTELVLRGVNVTAPRVAILRSRR